MSEFKPEGELLREQGWVLRALLRLGEIPCPSCPDWVDARLEELRKLGLVELASVTEHFPGGGSTNENRWRPTRSALVWSIAQRGPAWSLR